MDGLIRIDQLDRLMRFLLTSLWLLSSTAFGASVTDDLGRQVTVASPAQRIITLSPHSTEFIRELGIADRLVAAANDGKSLPATTQVISGYGALDREWLLSKQPDLVIAWGSGNRSQDIAWLTENKIPTFVSEPASLKAIADTLIKLGKLTDSQIHAQQASDQFLHNLQQACPTAVNEQEVHIVIWDQPAMTLGGEHWLNELLEKAHFKNTWQHIKRMVFTIEREAAMNKQTIAQVDLRQGQTASEKRFVSEHLNRPSPSLALGLKELCEQRRN
jgi:iron complex transport system substrate-binding protein